MSIEKSLGHGFPIITVGGEPYHYGRENTFGKYLVEHVHDARDCWCFAKQEDLTAFLLRWPMTPERQASFRTLPDGTKVTHERRGENVDHERPDPIKGISAMGLVKFREPIILQRDNEGSGEYAVFTDPMHRDSCDDVMVEVRSCDDPHMALNEKLIHVRVVPRAGHQAPTLTVCRRQALKLAGALLKAATYAEERMVPLPADVAP